MSIGYEITLNQDMIQQIFSNLCEIIILSTPSSIQNTFFKLGNFSKYDSY